MTTRYSLVTTGETGDSRNADGTRVSSMGLAPQPVSSVRKKPTNPWLGLEEGQLSGKRSLRHHYCQGWSLRNHCCSGIHRS